MQKPPQKLVEQQGIKVYLRIRPDQPKDSEEIQFTVNSKDEEDKDQTIIIKQNKKIPHSTQSNTFNFNAIFSQSDSQERVYSTALRNDIKNVVNGFNCCIITYGKNGTGKTYTLIGEENGNEGIVQLAVDDLYDNIDKDEKGIYKFIMEKSMQPQFSLIQLIIYIIQDLLTQQGKISQMQECKVIDSGKRIVNHRKQDINIQIDGKSQLKHLIKQAFAYRQGSKISQSLIKSSRSHLIGILTVERTVYTNNVLDHQTIGKFAFVDLAYADDQCEVNDPNYSPQQPQQQLQNTLLQTYNMDASQSSLAEQEKQSITQSILSLGNYLLTMHQQKKNTQQQMQQSMKDPQLLQQPQLPKEQRQQQTQRQQQLQQRPQSPQHRPQSPQHKPQSPQHRPQSPQNRPQSPQQRQQSPLQRQQSPRHGQQLPEQLQTTLSQPEHYIPYRSCKLTEIIHKFINGHSKTILILTCSQKGSEGESVEKSRLKLINTLEFSRKFNNISYSLKQNIIWNEKKFYLDYAEQLEKENKTLVGKISFKQFQLQKYSKVFNDHLSQFPKLQQEYLYFQNQIKLLMHKSKDQQTESQLFDIENWNAEQLFNVLEKQLATKQTACRFIDQLCSQSIAGGGGSPRNAAIQFVEVSSLEEQMQRVQKELSNLQEFKAKLKGILANFQIEKNIESPASDRSLAVVEEQLKTKQMLSNFVSKLAKIGNHDQLPQSEQLQKILLDLANYYELQQRLRSFLGNQQVKEVDEFEQEIKQRQESYSGCLRAIIGFIQPLFPLPQECLQSPKSGQNNLSNGQLQQSMNNLQKQGEIFCQIVNKHFQQLTGNILLSGDGGGGNSKAVNGGNSQKLGQGIQLKERVERINQHYQIVAAFCLDYEKKMQLVQEQLDQGQKQRQQDLEQENVYVNNELLLQKLEEVKETLAMYTIDQKFKEAILQKTNKQMSLLQVEQPQGGTDIEIEGNKYYHDVIAERQKAILQHLELTVSVLNKLDVKGNYEQKVYFVENLINEYSEKKELLRMSTLTNQQTESAEGIVGEQLAVSQMEQSGVMFKKYQQAVFQSYLNEFIQIFNQLLQDFAPEIQCNPYIQLEKNKWEQEKAVIQGNMLQLREKFEEINKQNLVVKEQQSKYQQELQKHQVFQRIKKFLDGMTQVKQMLMIAGNDYTKALESAEKDLAKENNKHQFDAHIAALQGKRQELTESLLNCIQNFELPNLSF